MSATLLNSTGDELTQKISRHVIYSSEHLHIIIMGYRNSKLKRIKHLKIIVYLSVNANSDECRYALRYVVKRYTGLHIRNTKNEQ